MEHQDKKLEIWKEAIPRMNEEDLEFILDFPECFEPKVLRMVKRRYDKITKPEDGEEEYEKVEERMETFILNTKMGDICINYSIYKDTNELAVNCGTRTLFFEHIPNRKGYLEYLLDRFFFAHQFVEYKMQQLYEEDHPNERVN